MTKHQNNNKSAKVLSKLRVNLKGNKTKFNKKSHLNYLKRKRLRYLKKKERDLIRKKNYILYRSIKFKWKRFFVVKKWRRRSTRFFKDFYYVPNWLSLSKKLKRKHKLKKIKDRIYGQLCFSKLLNTLVERLYLLQSVLLKRESDFNHISIFSKFFKQLKSKFFKFKFIFKKELFNIKSELKRRNKSFLTSKILNKEVFLLEKKISLLYCRILISSSLLLKKKIKYRIKKKYTSFRFYKKPKYSNIFFYTCSLKRVRYWRAYKVKKHRSFKIWYNFLFFFNRFFISKLATIRSYLGHIKERYKSFFSKDPNKFNNKSKNSFLIKADKRLIYRARKKSKVFTKKDYWRKLMLKKFLMGYYFIRNQLHLKFLIKEVRKHAGHKLINFYFYFESRVLPTCIRLGFFWHRRKGVNWIRWGFVYVNGFLAKSLNVRVRLNSILRVIVPIKLWSVLSKKRRISFFLLRFGRILFNYYELSLSYYLAIVINIPRSITDMKINFLKKKKMWVNLKAFSSLLHAYN